MRFETFQRLEHDSISGKMRSREVGILMQSQWQQKLNLDERTYLPTYLPTYQPTYLPTFHHSILSSSAMGSPICDTSSTL